MVTERSWVTEATRSMVNKPIGRTYIQRLNYYAYVLSRGRECVKAALHPNYSYLIPDFNCPEIDQLFQDYNHSYYHINGSLGIDWSTVDMTGYDFLYVVNYFGMKHIIPSTIDLPITNITLIEDNVFHYNFEINPDFTRYIGFNSLRKILPMDGLSMVKSTMIGSAYNREHADFHRLINATNIDSGFIRENNYNRLNDLLAGISINIKPGFYSFYSISIKNRDYVQKKLFNDNIFLPVMWRNTKNELSDTILQIPVDERYNKDDMTRIANLVLKYAQ